MHLLLGIIYLFFYLIYTYIEAVIRMFVPAKKKSFAGRLVLVTGAGHGIGRELALQFSQCGARLVLWDINKETNEKTANEIRRNGGSAVTFICDVSKRDNIKAVATEVRQQLGDVDVLVNNAGILHGGALLKLSEDDIQLCMDINIMAYIWTCREFLPGMINRNEGHIINIASAAGKGGVAYLTDYSASKHAVSGFTEALADEMRREGHGGISCTTVYPMFVDTGMAKYARDRFGQLLSPEEVASAVIEGAQRNQPTVFIPSDLEMKLRITGIFPRKFSEKMREVLDIGIDPQYEEKHD